MDSFETLVSLLLELDGYWVQPSFKVELTREDKVAIEKPSCPRWELDIVAYKGGTNEILVVECKSYLDSRGVVFEDLSDGGKSADRYKLFVDERIRRIVLNRLREQLTAAGSCSPSPDIKLCLAAGRVATDGGRQQIHQFFEAQKWLFMDEEWLRSKIQKVADGRYQNHVAAIVAKLLLPRSPKRNRPLVLQS